MAPPGEDLVGLGGDLTPETLVGAYTGGMFPMDVAVPRFASPPAGVALADPAPGRTGRWVLGWWSPDPRAILPLDRLRVSASLRQSARRYRVTVDSAFAAVMAACAAARPDQVWITPDFRRAFLRLHRLGYAHSVEAWEGELLVGGLYGVQIGGLFAGESMFHRARDASKVALVALVEHLREGPDRLLDVQWQTDHLARMGAVTIPRAEYLAELPRVTALPGAFPSSPRGDGEPEPPVPG
ncbi:MAG: leucyl/phenylalanyl-tRNA--protein transferase [Actinomycetales bacterium]|nr:leucyl/phenylalanyl-tRNA--protein transferase [Actinomycetales bacterium]